MTEKVAEATPLQQMEASLKAVEKQRDELQERVKTQRDLLDVLEKKHQDNLKRAEEAERRVRQLEIDVDKLATVQFDLKRSRDLWKNAATAIMALEEARRLDVEPGYRRS